VASKCSYNNTLHN